MKINYLSHSSKLTGGYRHENFLAEKLALTLNKTLNKSIELKKIHLGKYFTNFLDHLSLIFWGFEKSNANVNIVVARLALSSIFRNLLNSNKTIVVLHNYDKNDHKSTFYAFYFRFFLWFLKTIKPKNVSLICISDYWQKFFNQKINQAVPVFVFPNLLEVKSYINYRIEIKKNQIYLGLISKKNDYSEIEKLTKKLSDLGYNCLFTSMKENFEPPFENHQTRKVSYEKYLEIVAESKFTIAFPKVEEGWSRIAHESILLGTPVIGYQKGGLGNLLEEGQSIIVKNAEEAVDVILNKKIEIDENQMENFREKYDISQAEKYILPIIQFIKKP